MRLTVIAAILGCSAAFVQSTVVVFAQQQVPTFEVASIKPNVQGEAAGFKSHS